MPRSAFVQLKLMHQLHLFLEMPDLAAMIYALVTFCLYCCNQLSVGLPLKTLQLVQNEAARLLTQPSYREHITTALATRLFLGLIQTASDYL